MFQVKLVLMTLILAGCSTRFSDFNPGINTSVDPRKPRVHLHLYGDHAHKAEEYVKAIQREGYWVKQRNNDLPLDDKKSFIVYMLPSSQYFELEKIQRIIEKYGVREVQVYYGNHGKHVYTEGNIGVYLL